MLYRTMIAIRIPPPLLGILSERQERTKIVRLSIPDSLTVFLTVGMSGEKTAKPPMKQKKSSSKQNGKQ